MVRSDSVPTRRVGYLNGFRAMLALARQAAKSGRGDAGQFHSLAPYLSATSLENCRLTVYIRR
jgi:hypothetical protein